MNQEVGVAEEELCYSRKITKPQHVFKTVGCTNSLSPIDYRDSIKVIQEKIDQLKDQNHSKDPFEQLDVMFKRMYKTIPDSVDVGHVKVLQTKKEFFKFLTKLKSKSIMAIDLEHNSENSFLGYVCLLQISFMSEDYITEDYIVDPFIFHDVIPELKSVFEDVKILKIVHGGQSDIHWLQREYNIFLANVFDTQKACIALNKEKKSLNSLLIDYCKEESAKELQLHDWRLRPLEPEVIHYAAMDSRFLMHIAYTLILEAKAHGSLKEIWDESDNMCKNLFKHKTMLECANQIIKKFDPSNLTPESQKILFRNLTIICAWRDVEARLHDERPRFVLEGKQVWQVAEGLSKGNSFMTVYKELETPPSLILEYHHKSLEKFINDNLVSHQQTGKFNLGYLAEELEICLQHTCRRDIFNYSFAKDFKNDLERLENGMTDNITESNRYWKENQKQKQKSNKKEEGAKKIMSKSGLCENCAQNGTLTKHSIVPDSYRSFFPDSYRDYMSNHFYLLCNRCLRNTKHTTAQIIRTISEENDIEQEVHSRIREQQKQSSTHVMVAVLDEEVLKGAESSMSTKSRQIIEDRIMNSCGKRYKDLTAEDRERYAKDEERKISQMKEREELANKKFFEVVLNKSDEDVDEEYKEAHSKLQDEGEAQTFIEAARFVNNWRMLFTNKGFTFKKSN